MKERVAVLMGGSTNEREISLISGKAVVEALSNRSFQVMAIDVNNEAKLEEELKKNKIDVVFIALHGRFGEDGSVQRLLEKLNIPYTGSGVNASFLAFNKIEAKKIFQLKNVPTPPFFILGNGQDVKPNLKKMPFEFPWVVKPEAEGSSIGLSIVERVEGLDKALSLSFSYGARVLIEKYIQGREITIGILDEYPLPIVEVIPKNQFYDYRAKYTKGLSEYVVPAAVELEVYKNAQKIALAAHQALGCETMSRVDMRLDRENQPYVLEINTIPGLTELSLLPKAARAIGISFPDLCTILVKLAKSRWANREKV